MRRLAPWVALATVVALPLLACGGALTLIWDDPENNPARLARYRVERSTDGGRSWSVWGFAPPTERVWEEATWPTHLTCYRVLAVARTEPEWTVSPPSNVLCVGPPPAPQQLRAREETP